MAAVKGVAFFLAGGSFGMGALGFPNRLREDAEDGCRYVG